MTADRTPATAARAGIYQCPHPTKRRYASKAFADAVAAADTIRRSKPHYAYHCQCEWWHLTTKPVRNERMTIDAATKTRSLNGAAKPLHAPMTLPHTPVVASDRYTITPPVAAYWLDNYNTHNRPLRPSLVEMLTGALARGEWIENGDTIRFSRDGVLRDGQHRLAAVRGADRPIQALVVTGLEPESQITMDVGARRSFADTLKLNGELDQSNLAAVVGRIWRWENGQLRGQNARPSQAQLLAVLAAHPEAREAVTVGRRVTGHVKMAPSIASFAWCLFNPIDVADTDYFFDRVTDGAALEDGHAILALRRTLHNNSQTRAKLPDYVILALVIKSWNAFRQGKTVRNLAWKSGGAAPETFPEPV